MDKNKIEFNRPKETVASHNLNERMIDWHEDGHHVIKVLTDYDKAYRKKICSKCPLEQQQKRDCLKLDMYSPEGIQLKHCRHMDKARVQKHKGLIRKHMASHPLW